MANALTKFKFPAVKVATKAATGSAIAGTAAAGTILATDWLASKVDLVAQHYVGQETTWKGAAIRFVVGFALTVPVVLLIGMGGKNDAEKRERRRAARNVGVAMMIGVTGAALAPTLRQSVTDVVNKIRARLELQPVSSPTEVSGASGGMLPTERLARELNQMAREEQLDQGGNTDLAMPSARGGPRARKKRTRARTGNPNGGFGVRNLVA